MALNKLQIAQRITSHHVLDLMSEIQDVLLLERIDLENQSRFFLIHSVSDEVLLHVDIGVFNWLLPNLRKARSLMRRNGETWVVWMLP